MLAIVLMERGVINPEHILSHRFPLKEIEKAVERMGSRQRVRERSSVLDCGGWWKQGWQHSTYACFSRITREFHAFRVVWLAEVRLISAHVFAIEGGNEVPNEGVFVASLHLDQK